MKRELFTIGHSRHSREEFLKLLQTHRIEAVVDVRSNPFSRWSPQFSRNALEKFLEENGIRYIFLGDELGARRVELECYKDGVAAYDRIAKLTAFLDGLARMRKGAEQFRLVLMCAEKDPLECHRTILVCRQLRDEYRILHILHDGTIETNEEAEQRLLKEERARVDDLFFDANSLLARAYDKRGTKIAYQRIVPTARKSS